MVQAEPKQAAPATTPSLGLAALPWLALAGPCSPPCLNPPVPSRRWQAACSCRTAALTPGEAACTSGCGSGQRAVELTGS